MQLVDDQVCVVVVLQKLDDPLAPRLLHPQHLSKLNRNAEVWQPLPEVFHESIRRWGGEEPFRKLEDDRAQLAGIVQRLQPLTEPIPDAFLLLRPQAFEVEI